VYRLVGLMGCIAASHDHRLLSKTPLTAAFHAWNCVSHCSGVPSHCNAGPHSRRGQEGLLLCRGAPHDISLLTCCTPPKQAAGCQMLPCITAGTPCDYALMTTAACDG
jgi:hypothetical protein